MPANVICPTTSSPEPRQEYGQSEGTITFVGLNIRMMIMSICFKGTESIVGMEPQPNSAIKLTSGGDYVSYLDNQHVDDPGVTDMRVLIEFLPQPLSALLRCQV